MLVYENQFPVKSPFKFPQEVHQHIMDIIDASPTSQFFCHLATEIPNIYVYLFEHNPLEAYTICHIFSCDQIGEDYTYQSLSSSQIHMMDQFVLKANLT
ncbi:hypothetical protein NSS79_01240 [Paenibacillus sp. FSL L8-0436]|uniref:hypothetical protein n=1 Tax=Paenibacillus sp. FSL L8-0436 TaxID=2954686 RepID=UPI003158E12D